MSSQRWLFHASPSWLTIPKYEGQIAGCQELKLRCDQVEVVSLLTPAPANYNLACVLKSIP